MKVWSFFQPTVHKIIVFFSILLLWVIPTWKDATCKICWEQGYGFPINFIRVDSITGPYPGYWVGYFNFQVFLFDVFLLYLLACLIIFVSYHLYKKKEVTP
jgi:hypothetical protein